MFPNIAPDFAMANLHAEILNRKLEEEGRDTSPDSSAPAARSDQAALIYSPSPERRRANLAQFAARTHADNPESAAQMEHLFASTDVIEQFGAALAPYGYSTDNVADAYAFWWMTAWEGAQGSNRSFGRSEMQAVQAQSRDALLSAPEFARMGDAEKQQMAEAMLIQAAMIDGMVDMAKQQPDLMPQLRAAILQGARASGLDLSQMALTNEGFKPTN
ncbi:DUF6683 family protein [Croceibacterium ferulae]|uniref:DUF6683 family protein n=1 Tax=Croceibacterium ferulae TaxID=1854641 RepID=UPI0030C8BD56